MPKTGLNRHEFTKYNTYFAMTILTYNTYFAMTTV